MASPRDTVMSQSCAWAGRSCSEDNNWGGDIEGSKFSGDLEARN